MTMTAPLRPSLTLEGFQAVARLFRTRPDLLDWMAGPTQHDAHTLEWVERELHPKGDTPQGEGWYRIPERDGIELAWERKRTTSIKGHGTLR